MKKLRIENHEIYFSIKIHDKNGKAREINDRKILKAVTYAIVDKILKKDDVLFIELEDEYGLKWKMRPD